MSQLTDYNGMLKLLSHLTENTKYVYLKIFYKYLSDIYFHDC